VEAINGWILVEDYRFLTTLLDLLPPGEQARYSKRADAAKRESCARLGTAVADAVIAVEQAVIDGLLAEEDRAIFEAELMSVHAESLSEFGSIKHKIQRIVGEIDQVRSERLQALEGEWEKLQRDFGPPQYPPELCERVRAFFEEQFRLRRTRVVAERLAILTEVVEQHSSLESVVTVPEETVDYLLRFRDMQPQLTEWGLRGLPQLRRSLREDPPGPFSSAIEQMDDVLDAWSGLKRRAAPASGENPGAVQRIAEFLGFSLGVPDANLQPRMGENWLHLTIPASAEMSDVRPFRYFGSDSAGVQRFMCVWDFRDAHEVTDLLVREHLDKSATIVVFLKPLTYDQRGLVPRDCGAGWELPAALVDEHLLLFLCTIEPKSRLRAFLHCAMPFTSVNPYVFSGELPPEMFYGRRDMGTRLQGASGSCIVYGGRQLGKTSLLKQAGRDFQSQGAKRYCFWKRLDSAFPTLGGTPASALWAIIRDGLKQVRLLASNITAAQFEALGAHIENAISTQGAHVLALLDESDNFLAADEHDGFQVVRQVADLMQRTNGRFRVIFAGVHHVQRFQAVPNNPLAHLGEPQLVGPLETAAAQALVVEPLEAVGVRFENQHDASLVLSYTNYHPALIQFLCRSLLEKIMPRRSRQAPPYIVTQADIDAVYRTGKVRDQMRMLFDLTLRLDERYRALVWIMIEQQMDKIGEPLEEFGIAGLLDLARSWWPRGFGEISHEEFQSLLIEMRGLGLLVRTASRLWRLRSPNIAPLFGTEEDVRSNILALEKRPAASRSEASSFHMALDDGGEEYSLLSFGQELRLNQSRFGVGLLFASRATNLEGAAKALERFLPTYAARETMRFERMPLPRPSPGALRRRLEETLQQGTTADRILVVVELPAAEADQLRDMVAEALEFCIRNSARAKKRFLRVFFVFGPESARNWLALPRLEREEIEGRCDGVECAKRWEQVAVMRRLTETQKQDTEDVCRQVYETTGGWGWLIDEVFKAAGRRSDPRIACEQLRKRIESPTFAGELREKLGLQGDCDGWLALQKLVPAKNLPVQELTPDLVECDLTPQRFDAALEFLKRLDCFVAVSSDTIAVDSFLAQHLGVHAAAH